MTRRTPRPVARHEFWVRALRGWDVGFYAITAVAGVSIAIEVRSLREAAVAVLGLAALVVAYLALGRRGAQRGDVLLTRTYLAVLVTVVVLEVGLSELGSVLLFVGYSQIWFFATRRLEGVLWSVLLTVAFAAAIVVREPGAIATVADAAELVGQVGTGLVFAIALGLWITWVSEQSEERAALVEELGAAQAELASTHHASGVLAERARLAQEIHDTLAQGFTSVVMLAQAASAELARDRVGPATERVGQIEQVARDNLAQARALVAAFGPPELERGTLGDALDRLAARFEAETHVRVEVDGLRELGAVGPEHAVVLLRAAQEALANVRKHADATVVRLAVGRDGDDVRLEVVDDGRGLPADAVEGVGLRGMRERVDAGGGTLEVGSGPGGGTRVAVTLPHDTVPATSARDDGRATGPRPGTTGEDA
ncbi:sensor histidine kinase [Cellulomonas algicola]|uniref:Oxygen sensor histidine kinase NreB n=1 Tax=Cellulomonas algicola TaxID=2071633 RepID=A0A401UXQ5_9CELL|nr:sensor histidine kinase [Cellulomonas algicola]GCD19477.1 two-component sensor histidine kinase [Cellulomonas algicola]